MVLLFVTMVIQYTCLYYEQYIQNVFFELIISKTRDFLKELNLLKQF